MRALITGGRTSISNDDPKNRNFECSVWAVQRAFELADYQCDVLPAEFGMDLSQYNVIFVEPPTPGLISSTRCFDALWVLDKRHDAVILHDHYDTRRLYAAMHRLATDNEWAKRLGATGAVRYVAKRLSTGSGEWRNAIHAHPWGDHALLAMDCPFDTFDIVFDPAPLMRRWSQTSMYVGRESRWVHAAWDDHRKWIGKLGIKWPVLLLGRRSNGAEGKRTLPELMSDYASSQGSLVHPYANAGSGYFRSRYVYALDGGCVLGLDQVDAAVMDDDLFLAPVEIEQLNNDELRMLADAQAEWFWEKSWTQEELVHRLVEGL